MNKEEMTDKEFPIMEESPESGLKSIGVPEWGKIVTEWEEDWFPEQLKCKCGSVSFNIAFDFPPDSCAGGKLIIRCTECKGVYFIYEDYA